MEGDHTRFTAAQSAGIQIRRADQDRTLHAIHQLEAALGSAARHNAWQTNVLNALRALYESTTEEQRNADQPDSLLSDIARTQPRLRNRVRGIRAQYKQLHDTIESLQRELTHDEAMPDFADIRQRLAWLLTALRHQRARESDLIYEGYYEAFNADMETETAKVGTSPGDTSE